MLDGRKHVDSKWVFKNKLSVTRKVEKYKDQMEEKGYSQVEGIYFCEIFSLVAKLNFIIFLTSLTIAFNIEVEKMDVRTTFLHGDLDE